VYARSQKTVTRFLFFSFLFLNFSQFLNSFQFFNLIYLHLVLAVLIGLRRESGGVLPHGGEGGGEGRGDGLAADELEAGPLVADIGGAVLAGGGLLGHKGLGVHIEDGLGLNGGEAENGNHEESLVHFNSK